MHTYITQVRGLVSLLKDLAPSQHVEAEILMGKKTVGNWGWSRRESQTRQNDDDDDDLEEDDSNDVDVPVLVVLNKLDLMAGGEAQCADVAQRVIDVVQETLGAEDVKVRWVSCATGMTH
jgi:hypothetical protein